MERALILIVALLLSACTTMQTSSSTIQVDIPEIYMSPCLPGLTQLTMDTPDFADVLAARQLDRQLYKSCSDKVTILQKAIRGLEDVEIIRLTTPRSEKSGLNAN